MEFLLEFIINSLKYRLLCFIKLKVLGEISIYQDVSVQFKVKSLQNGGKTIRDD